MWSAAKSSEASSTNGHRGTARVETRAITTAATSAGEMLTPDRQAGVVTLPKRRMTIRALLAPGRTDSKSVEFVRQAGFTNNAAVVAEGAQKPEVGTSRSRP